MHCMQLLLQIWEKASIWNRMTSDSFATVIQIWRMVRIVWNKICNHSLQCGWRKLLKKMKDTNAANLLAQQIWIKYFYCKFKNVTTSKCSFLSLYLYPLPSNCISFTQSIGNCHQSVWICSVFSNVLLFPFQFIILHILFEKLFSILPKFRFRYLMNY